MGSSCLCGHSAFAHGKNLFFIFLLSCLVAIPVRSAAQEHSGRISYCLILLDNGTTLKGKVTHADSAVIHLETYSQGPLVIELNRVVRIIPFYNGETYRKTLQSYEPFSTRYFLAPTAFGPKKGDILYQNTWFLFNSVQAGLTKNISLGAGLELVSSLIASLNSNENITPIFFLSPKYSFRMAKPVTGAIGVYYAHISALTSRLRSSAGYAYGMTTWGSREHNISVGMGYGFFEGTFARRNALMAGGMSRIAGKVFFISDNWFIPVDGEMRGIYSAGIRLAGEKKNWGLGLYRIPNVYKGKGISVLFADVTMRLF